MYEAAAVIEADPQTVWNVLTDLPNWTAWDSAVVQTEGAIEYGATIRLWPEVNPKRAFKVEVTELDPPRRMTFEGGMPLGLFRGTRTYRLEPAEEGATRFSMRETYSGLLSGLITRSIPDLQPSFQKFARGLKERAEGEKIEPADDAPGGDAPREDAPGGAAPGDDAPREAAPGGDAPGEDASRDDD